MRPSLLLLCLLAFALLAARAQESRPSTAREDRAAIWLADALARSLDAKAASDVDLAAEALALRSLARVSAIDPRRLEALRLGFGARQRDDGSFGAAAASESLTWLAWGALESDDSEAVSVRARRAHDWLSARGRSAPSVPGPVDSPSDPVRRALGFLRTTRVGADAVTEPVPEELRAVAGGAFDLRAAYAAALAGPESHLAAEVPAGALVREPLFDLALAVLVLDHYRTTREAALLAEIARPPAEIERVLAAHRDSNSGAWSAGPGQAPSLASTACGLLIEDALERWATSRGAASDAEPLGGARRVATLESMANACESCHATLQPGQHAQWLASAHAKKHVGCAECHGTNHSMIFRESGKVATAICAKCHARAAQQFSTSKHARAQETLESSALFASTPPAARAACTACHRIGERQADGTHGNCNFCHTAHTFDARDAREPEACTLCHTGRDYPQDEAWRLSKHGALYQTTRDPEVAPTCATCHHPGGRHDDGFGITFGASGVGAVLEGAPSAFAAGSIATAEFAARRAEMVLLCTQCHSSRLAEKSLREADELKHEGDAQLLEGATLLRELAAEGLFGADVELDLGPQYARPDPTRPGAILLERYYRMWRFAHATAWKGAYHQSPSLSNNRSGEGTEDELRQLRAEAERWRKEGKSR